MLILASVPFISYSRQTLYSCCHIHCQYSAFGAPSFKTLFATTLYRITNASSVNELTTGRLAILDEYLREISSSPGIMLWGKGLSAHLLKKGTHNLFLEIQYYLGLFGLILFLLYFGILIIRIYKNTQQVTQNQNCLTIHH